MTAQAALRDAVARLKAAGVPDPARDARLLLAHAMEIGMDRLTLHLGDELALSQASAFAALVGQRVLRQPVSQIIGRREFFGYSYKVTPQVLDPRPETETLVIEALQVPFNTVLDVGVGSGCLLLTLLKERPEARGLGIDVSDGALTVAAENARTLGLSQRAVLKKSDWFNSVEGRFDLITSNPPYIDEEEWLTLEPEPREWEPKHALTPGKDGLEPYRILATHAPNHLTSKGHLMVEIGWQQGPAVSEIFTNAGLQNVRVVRDLDGRDRVIVAQNPE